MSDKALLVEFCEWFMQKQRKNTRCWKTPEEQAAQECPNAHDVAVFLFLRRPHDAPPVNLEPSPHRVLKVLTEAPTPPLPTAADLERIRQQSDAWHKEWKKQNALMMSESGKATGDAPPAPRVVVVDDPPPTDPLSRLSYTSPAWECPECHGKWEGTCQMCPDCHRPALLLRCAVPQRFWRVVPTFCDLERKTYYLAFACDTHGTNISRLTPGFGHGRATEKLAEQDGVDSGLDPWSGSGDAR
jgi:hypothetical protein